MSTISETAHNADTGPHYDIAQRTFHWAMAVIILTALAIGFYCSYLEHGTPERRFLLDIHKSLGLTALALLIVRLPYRLLKGAPDYNRPLPPLMHFAANFAHWALYALMAFMPLTGYVNSAAGGNTLPWFGLFQWPRIVPIDKALSHIGSFLHDWGAYAAYALIGLHIAAALYHRIILRDDILQRMWPTSKTHSEGSVPK